MSCLFNCLVRNSAGDRFWPDLLTVAGRRGGVSGTFVRGVDERGMTAASGRGGRGTLILRNEAHLHLNKVR